MQICQNEEITSLLSASKDKIDRQDTHITLLEKLHLILG